MTGNRDTATYLAKYVAKAQRSNPPASIRFVEIQNISKRAS